MDTQVVKCRLDQIVKNPQIKQLLNEAVENCNMYYKHCSLFFKLWYLHCLENNSTLPSIRRNIFKDIMCLFKPKCDFKSKIKDKEGTIRKKAHAYKELVVQQKLLDNWSDPKTIKGQQKIVKDLRNEIKLHKCHVVQLAELHSMFNFYNFHYTHPEEIFVWKPWYNNILNGIDKKIFTSFETFCEYRVHKKLTQVIKNLLYHKFFPDPDEHVHASVCAITNDLLCGTPNFNVLNEGIGEFVERMRTKLTFDYTKTKDGEYKTNLGGQVKKFKDKYLKILVDLGREWEDIVMEQRSDETLKSTYKLVNCFPFSRDFKVVYIPFDKTTLGWMFYNEIVQLLPNKPKDFNSKTKCISADHIALQGYALFNIKGNRRVFGHSSKTWLYSGIIETGGFGCSITRNRTRDLVIKNGKYTFKQVSTGSAGSTKDPKSEYFKDFKLFTKSELTEPGRVNVGCDPGSCNALTFWADSEDLSTEHNFKESPKSSLAITGRWLYNNITDRRKRQKNLHKRKKYTPGSKTVYGDDTLRFSLEGYERLLGSWDHNTLKYSVFKEACEFRNKILKDLWDFNFKFQRKDRWQAYNDSRKADHEVVKHFAKKYAPDGTFATLPQVNLHMGDWSAATGMKYGNAPVKGMGYRRLFRRYGVKVGLVNEWNTSKTLNLNQEIELEKFKSKDRYGNLVKKHGILRSKIDSTNADLPNEYVYVCRDINAARNIRFKGMCDLGLYTRPKESKLFPKS